MRPQIPSSTSLPYPSQIIQGKNSSDSLTDLQSCMFSNSFRLQICAWIEKTTCSHGRRVGAVDQKSRKNPGSRAIVISEHTATPETRIPHQAPHLDAFDSNLAKFQIQVGHVAVALQSFRQDLHFAALRRGRNGQRLAAPRLHGGNVHASVLSASIFWRNSAPQCRSRAGHLPTPGHPIIQKTVALLLEWFDDPCSSLFHLYMLP